MSLPALYLEEIDALSRKISQAQPIDILQFCANHFHGRLEAERNQHLASQSSTSLSSMVNPFAMASDTFPGTFGGFGGGPFDGSRDAIREEEEELHSPTAPTFKPQFSMGGMGGRPGSSGSGRRTHSPSGGGGGGPRRPMHVAGSPFLSPSGGSHLGPPSAGQDFPSNYNRNRRTSVSAESLVPTTSDDEWSPPIHPKTSDQMNRLRAAVSNNFLFAHLDEEQDSQVLHALVEKPIPNKGMRVITQGDVGDYFYVVEKGDFDIYVNSAGRMMPGPDGMGKRVTSIGPGGSFGELALMYNAPRAATVISTSSDNILWALDRVTFRRILMENTFKRRRMYEAFLEEIPLLSSLITSERSKIADALDTETFEAGAIIIREGDPGDRFYFIEQGVAEVHKSSQPGGYVRTLNKGDYFGELALLNDAPRAATIVAKSKVKVAYLGKAGFQRLLGPVADIMRRNDPRLGEGVDPLAGPGGFDGSIDVMQGPFGMGRPVEV
ncbi:cyclic nucleotide-binding-like protein [Sphaerosporella brunnea]|uniref:cAMP-dependent protein kinase regulatory subunit n=1 Tax=Sphaerosporella brunnea TaxID=1250544 RepID=A0A5J5EHK2_9PEZI|nr:cyclic nucleotide-binding-like protein [Sphaerosporella brunnea]